MYDEIDPQPDGSASGQSFARFQGRMPELFLCPSIQRPPSGDGINHKSSYWGIAGARRADRVQTLEQSVCGDLFRTGPLYPASKTRFRKVTDGLSNTLLFGERIETKTFWMTGATWNGFGSTRVRICSEAANHVVHPINTSVESFGPIVVNDLPFGSVHPGGAHFAAADVSVHFLSEEIDQIVFENLATIAGGETIEKAW